ncbi:MAG: cysteine--tRNA ligase [Candidatus Omnitrophota bacterium]
MIHIHNTLTRKKEEFVPINPPQVNIYTCGVTVYDECHIGHARSLYVFDVIRRYLKYRGFDVRFVRNITDIDDKIINRANELKVNWQDLAKKYIDSYYHDLETLGIEKADFEPRATQNIPQMIEGIKVLIDKGYAYVTKTGVYFSVRKFKEYGKLSGQSIEEMLNGARIEPDETKIDKLDFALWKSSRENEPSWDSPWGPGRPGWHIECSVMSLDYLKAQTLDIHAGGRDLVFPHHENEIAQAQSLTNKTFSKYWIHHGLLTINSQKMSKSLGNFITIQDAAKKYSVDNLKLFFLSSHYRSPLDFTQIKMQEIHKAIQRFDILYWKASEIINKESSLKIQEAEFIKKNKDKFIEAMDDDFNTALAIGYLFDLVNDTNKFIDQQKQDKNYVNIIYSAVDTIEALAKDIFGLFKEQAEVNLTPEQKDLLEERKVARDNKDFKKSDELRESLKEKGIIVEDTKEGQVWRWQ